MGLRDQGVGVGRVADDENADVRGCTGVEGLALRLEDTAIGLQEIPPLHTGTSRARTHEQGDVDTIEGHAGIVGDVDPGQERERTIVQLHGRTRRRGERRCDLQKPEPHGDIGTKEMARCDPEKQCVANLTGSSGDGNIDGGLGHEHHSSFIGQPNASPGPGTLHVGGGTHRARTANDAASTPSTTKSTVLERTASIPARWDGSTRRRTKARTRLAASMRDPSRKRSSETTTRDTTTPARTRVMGHCSHHLRRLGCRR